MQTIALEAIRDLDRFPRGFMGEWPQTNREQLPRTLRNSRYCIEISGQCSNASNFNIGSFYLFDRRPFCDTRFKVHSISGTELDIEADLMVDVDDSNIDPKPPLRRVRVRTDVVFEGILVSPYGRQSKADERTLMAVDKQLFDVSAFEPPQRPKTATKTSGTQPLLYAYSVGFLRCRRNLPKATSVKKA